MAGDDELSKFRRIHRGIGLVMINKECQKVLRMTDKDDSSVVKHFY